MNLQQDKQPKKTILTKEEFKKLDGYEQILYLSKYTPKEKRKTS